MKLEERLLLAAASDLGNPGNFTAVDDQVFFSAEFSNGERRLGVTDGTAAGTRLLAGFAANSFLQDFVALNGKVYFVADDGVHGYELWMSDGTSAGTQMVVDINPGSSSSCFPDASSGLIRTAVLNGNLYFGADDGVHGRELWRTDGTAAGTSMIVDLNPGSAAGLHGEMLTIGSTVYFSGRANSIGGWDLCKTDGTSAGTILAADLPGFGLPGNLTDVNGTLYFSSEHTPSSVRTLWRSDGTPAGTVNIVGPTLGLPRLRPDPVLNGPPPPYAYFGSPFAVLDGSIIFAAYTSTNNVELWTSDGTTAGTVLLKEINTAAVGLTGSSPSHLTTIGGTVYFSAYEQTNGTELWKTDVTNAGTVLVRDLVPSFEGSEPISLVDLGGVLYFGARRSGLLYKSNGTFSGTVGVKAVSAKSLAVIDSKIYFNGNGELWISDGTTVGTGQIVDLTDPAIANNHVPPANISLSSSTIPEGPPANRSIGSFVSTDPEPGDTTFTYALVFGAGSDDNGLFEIVGSQLRKTAVFDFETKNSYSIRVRSTDQWGAAFEKVFTITVTDVNDPPSVGLTAVTPSVLENTSTPVAIATIVVTDDALGTNTLSLSGADAAAFEIVGNALHLKSGVAVDFESGKTSYAVTINVDDPAFTGIESSVDLLLSVTDIDEFDVGPVIDTDLAAGVVSEASASSTPIGITVFAVDADGTNNVIIYSLIDSAGGRFLIDAETGVVSTADDGVFDYETAASHSITVRAMSKDGSFSDESFTIQVTDVDEFNVSPIVDNDPSPNSVLEHSPAGTPVGYTAFASDADGTNNGVTYSLWNTRGGRFAIDPVTGVVTVANGEYLDREVTASWSLTVLATSQDGSVSVKEFTVDLVDVDEFNVGKVFDLDPAPNAIVENAPNGTPVGITGFGIDLDATNNTVTYSLWNTRAGRFGIDPATGVVTVANGALIDREAQGTWSITILATSSDGSISVKEFVIAVQDVDEHNVGKVFDLDPAPNTVVEHAATGTPVGITGFGIDLDATQSAVTYSLWNTRSGRFAIDPATGVVTVANGAILDREVAAAWTITILATSQDGSVSVKDSTITVQDVDEFDVGQVFDLDSNPNSVAENAANGTAVGIKGFSIDLDATTDVVTYLLADDAGGRFAIDSLSGVVTVANTSLLDWEAVKSWAITIRATSADGSENSRTFWITLLDVAD